MRSEKMPNTGTVAKLPQIQNTDDGAYVCTVYPLGNRTKAFAASVDVTVAGESKWREEMCRSIEE